MSTRRILVVDDKPTVAFFLGKTLECSNREYHVSIAHSGEEAIEIFGSTSIDLLVTDLCLPGISGLELIRHVRALSPQTRTILITAYGSDEIEAEARRLETYRYITKPFDIGNFTRVVEGALCHTEASQSRLLTLPNRSVGSVTQQLEELRRDVGAQCIFLADTQGQRLAEAGDATELNTPTLLSLLSGSLATTGALAQQISDTGVLARPVRDQRQVANLNFYAGTRYEIYSTNIGDNLFLAIVFDRQVQTSRIGIVWVYTQRTIKRLYSNLSTADSTPVGLNDRAPGVTPEDRGRNGEDEPEREHLDMETAIARGLIATDRNLEAASAKHDVDEYIHEVDEYIHEVGSLPADHEHVGDGPA